jgi:primosomal protein N' (replication factor Y)
MIARVSLDFAVGKEFDYDIPPQLEGFVGIGSRIKVPFGKRVVFGVVVDLPEASAYPDRKPILKVVGDQPLITRRILHLAKWIAGYYCCPLEVVLKAALPEAVRSEEAGYRERLTVRPAPNPPPAENLTKRQIEILALLANRTQVPLQAFLAEAGTTMPTLRRLEEAHFLTIASEVDERDPYSREQFVPTQPMALTKEQIVVLGEVLAAINASHRSNSELPLGAEEAESPRNFLLHGVTGSGKTEIYLQAIEHALSQGRGSIVLVPEIALTPQTVERFKARFSAPPRATMVAVLHSHLSKGERHDEWQKIRKNRARIVIGARSAIFAPVDNLGLIIVDEEHEHSYKQEESPRYNARDVAVVRARDERAVVVLGSATPSIESYHNALSGKYRLLNMTARVDDQKLPVVRVVDMRMETRKNKGPGIFSQQLAESIRQRLETGQQTILFLNRRGYASSMQCPKCGYVAGCPNCSVSLTYHRKDQLLLCHICGHRRGAPNVCPEPKCASPEIRFSGIGTEKVEETLGLLFPKARIARMDSDVMRRKEDYRRVLGEFKLGKIDILLGTQMIAKGLHFPNVTLVGIVQADMGLHMPDFRAGERTFQLLTQVSGRAGRGDVEGEVVVQAFTPYHPAIQYARRHDYVGFYEDEITSRRELSYPPFSRVAMLTFKSKDEKLALEKAESARGWIDQRLAGVADLVASGPAASPLFKAESHFRYQIMLRTRHMAQASRILAGLGAELRLPDSVSMAVDIDPASLV